MKMLVYPEIGLNIASEKAEIITVVCEDPVSYYEIISDIYKQITGEKGQIVFSEDYVPIDMSKKAEMLSQFVPFCVNKKELLGKIYQKLNGHAVGEDMYVKTLDLNAAAEKYMFELTNDFSAELEYERPSDMSWLYKAFGVKIREDGKSLTEKIIDHMLAVREYIGDKVFFMVGLRNYITPTQADDLFKCVLLNGLTMVCVESHETALSEYENRTIIDKDICIL